MDALPMKVLLRLHRKKTDSYLDIEVSSSYDDELDFDTLQFLVEDIMPEWEIITYSTEYSIGEWGYIHD